LNDGKPGHEKWLALDSLVTVIDYILHYPDHIPLLELRAGTEHL
jgi:hypothetical protein